MSTDFSIRPVGAPAPSPTVQPQTQAASEAVATQLPVSQSVTATDNGSSVRNDTQNLVLASVGHQAFYDREAASMVFQIVNSNTDQVVEQFPEEAVLRRRAYFHALDLAKGEQPRVIPTDRIA
jgi:uncharacterized FlaG/YvyC family protein